MRMNKISIFAVTLIASLAGIAVSFYLLSAGYQAPPTEAYMSDIMRRMMGGGMAQQTMVEPPLYIMILPVAFVATLIAGVAGFIYFLTLPEIKLSKTAMPIRETPPTESSLRQDRIDTIVKTMKPDELKVFNLLVSHGGKYLQKHVSKETELSRLKTHRIIARLAERGIVTVKPYGNTNEVSISDWLKSEAGTQ